MFLGRFKLNNIVLLLLLTGCCLRLAFTTFVILVFPWEFVDLVQAIKGLSLDNRHLAIWIMSKLNSNGLFFSKVIIRLEFALAFLKLLTT